MVSTIHQPEAGPPFLSRKELRCSRFPVSQHSGFYFPPSANKDRAVNIIEIKDFIILWTYSQWRQDLVVIPPFSPERETCCMLSICRTIAFLTYNAETGIPSCNLPFSSTASLWTSIDKPIKLLLSWKKGGPSKMGDSWFLYVNRKEWRVYDMSFFLVTRLLNARTCLFRTDSKQSLRPFVFIWKGNGTVPRLKSDCLPV